MRHEKSLVGCSTLMLSVVISLSVNLVVAQESPLKKCESDTSAGKYTLVNEGRTIQGPVKTSVYIAVKDKNFNVTFMRSLAERLKSVYCFEDDLSVMIFDNKKYASLDTLKTALETNNRIVRLRGAYTLNRSTGDESIRFSRQLGNPIEEVIIDLSGKAHN